jgi:drug/metabolite transporter (DMT)-like permease
MGSSITFNYRKEGTVVIGKGSENPGNITGRSGGGCTMNKGVVLAGAAGICWGTIPIAVKQTYAAGSATALEISVFRFVIAGIILGGITAARGEPILLRNKWSVLMGFCGVFWMSFVSFYGIQYTSAVNASILSNSNPLMVAALASGLRLEPVTWKTLGGIVLGITGVVLVSGMEADIHMLGDLLVLAAALGWAMYTVVGSSLKGYPSFTVTSSSLLWGLPFYAVALMVTGDAPQVSGATWIWILYIGLVPTALAFACYVKAVDLMGSTRAAVFQYLAPAVAVIISAAYGLEEITIFQIGGVAMIIGGIELTRRRGLGSSSFGK